MTNPSENSAHSSSLLRGVSAYAGRCARGRAYVLRGRLVRRTIGIGKTISIRSVAMLQMPGVLVVCEGRRGGGRTDDEDLQACGFTGYCAGRLVAV